ncbi:hypothetical protein SPLC1_S370710 [Arthrospira platensis C1]|uniref:Uncharacterized protein n=1 Tax=Limnospira maxima CS-328 TaxID=513049 RepID=B5VY51_LIMMA|nr:hypothetical protein AmaxDRAFT_1443 [Limnospira maxima CS-328]EKD07694.1 hypothetical protein SPLC1_S370710 [Arthrospira platensis C1]
MWGQNYDLIVQGKPGLPTLWAEVHLGEIYLESGIQ